MVFGGGDRDQSRCVGTALWGEPRSRWNRDRRAVWEGNAAIPMYRDGSLERGRGSDVVNIRDISVISVISVKWIGEAAPARRGRLRDEGRGTGVGINGDVWVFWYNLSGACGGVCEGHCLW